MKLGLSVKNQSVETSGITKDYKEALCEYIWNGFEANATRVELNFMANELGGVSEVVIHDNGDGIDYATLQDTFGAFLASQKSGLSMQLKSRANKGKGRFSFLAFASNIRWETVFRGEKSNLGFSILLDSLNKNECEVTEPSETNAKSGTTITISGVEALRMEDVTYQELEDTVLRAFAWYLYLNKNKWITLVINDTAVDYSAYINAEMSLTKTIEIENKPFTVTLIVWIERINENFCTYYLDDSNSVCGKDTTTFNRNTVNFNHSVFVMSPYFNSKSDVSLTDVTNEVVGQTVIEPIEAEKNILQKLKKTIQNIISKSLSEHMSGQTEKAVHDMMERKSFPRFSSDAYGEMRKSDLITVTKELYRLDSRIFYRLKPVQEKSFLGLLNLLLSSEERENVLTIVESIVELSTKQREDFARVLKRTRLENIVMAIRFIEERYTVIEGLRAIVFDYANYANERDHVQKIIEQHYWLFGEQYHLVTADQRMRSALKEYLHILYGDSAPAAILAFDEEERRRMDIFVCGTRQTESGSETPIEENLIVELKAPGVVMTKKVLRQIEDYMDFVRKQPQFNSQYRKWKFVAVCREVDDDVKSRYSAAETHGKKGLVTKIDNYEVYALTWDDVFRSFGLSHGFILNKLKTDREAISQELKQAINTDSSRKTVDQLTSKICSVS